MTGIVDEIMAVALAADPTGRPKEGAPVHPESVIGALDGIRQRREAADRIRVDAMSDLAAWLDAARYTGLSVTDIARLSGVSRQTVYALSRAAR